MRSRSFTCREVPITVGVSMRCSLRVRTSFPLSSLSLSRSAARAGLPTVPAFDHLASREQMFLELGFSFTRPYRSGQRHESRMRSTGACDGSPWPAARRTINAAAHQAGWGNFDRWRNAFSPGSQSREAGDSRNGGTGPAPAGGPLPGGDCG